MQRVKMDSKRFVELTGNGFTGNNRYKYGCKVSINKSIGGSSICARDVERRKERFRVILVGIHGKYP